MLDEVAQRALRHAPVGQHRDAHQVRGGGLLDGDARLLYDRREAARSTEDGVLHVRLRHVEIAVEVEGDGYRRGAVVAAGRGHVAHSLDPVDRFFQGSGHAALDGCRVGADVDRRDADLGRRDLRVLRDRKRRQGDESGDEDDDGRDAREHRSTQKKLNHAAFVVRASRIARRARKRRVRTV